MNSDRSFEFHSAVENVPPEPHPLKSVVGKPTSENATHNLYEVSQPWPLIKTDESRFIENTGGEYVGFVGREDGRRQFGDFRVSRCAYYDEDYRAVIEGFVATEAVNDEGTNELAEPSEIEGFALMLIKKDLSGHQLGDTKTILLRPKDFPTRNLTVQQLRSIVVAAHDLVCQDVSKMDGQAVFRRVHALLELEGWAFDINQNGGLASFS